VCAKIKKKIIPAPKVKYHATFTPWPSLDTIFMTARRGGIVLFSGTAPEQTNLNTHGNIHIAYTKH